MVVKSMAVNKRHDLQALRGIAVVAILLFHAFPHKFQNGYLGVDLFFAISGFVVTPLIAKIFRPGEKKYANFLEFARRRFYRLVPALLFMLTISAILILIFGAPVDHLRFARQGFASILMLGNFGALRYAGNYFAPNPNPLIHTWSLAVEVQIYFFLPAVFSLITTKVKPKLYNRRSLWIMSFSTLISFLIFNGSGIYRNLVGMFPEPLLPSDIAFYSPLGRIWEFGLGGISSLILQPGKGLQSKKLANILLLLLGILLLNPVYLPEKMITPIIVCVACTIFVTSNSISDKRLDQQALKWIGDRSYSIYLLHFPFIYLATFSGVFSFPNSNFRVPQEILAISLSIFFGNILFKRIENRFRNVKEFSSSKVSLNKVLVMIASLCIFLLGVINLGGSRLWGVQEATSAAHEAGWSLPISCVFYGTADRPCLHKNVNSYGTVLLVGDSHAAHFSNSIFVAAKNQNFDVAIWTKSGCQIEFSDTLRTSNNGCKIQLKQIFRWIKAQRPVAVIVSERVTARVPSGLLEDGLGKIRKTVPNVLLISNTPEFADGTTYGFNRPLILQYLLGPSKHSIKKDNLLKTNVASSIKLDTYAKMNQIEVLNLTSLYCPQGVCSRYKDGHWLFIDDTHLSVYGARLATPGFENYLRSLTRPR
jgi:peptidoglycan/LPS O-acetylase OafA/YrhL